jgi:hypothetical protein
MLLRQNRQLRALRIYNWSLPALAARLPDGRTVKVCPSAGVCASVCYARNGTFLWPVVKARHTENLRLVLDEPDRWQQEMLAELARPRFEGAWVRLHDSGDFFSREYLGRWLEIIRARPQTRFYCYTKEVRLFRDLVEPNPPANFWWVYSYGGIQDSALDTERDRVADVFPDEESIAAAGWHSQAESDLLSVLGPRQVGIPANNIARFKARQNGRKWSDWQAATDAARREKLARPSPTAAPSAVESDAEPRGN